MLEVALLGSVLIVAGVGLRRRGRRGEDGGASERDEEKVKTDPGQYYLSSLAVPSVVALVLLGVYYWLTPARMEALMQWPGCQKISPTKMASEWDYVMGTREMRNVSGDPVAQTLFDQGMVMRWGYSPEGAMDAFDAALEVDAGCAMCYWGRAYAVSPFINIVALPPGTRFPHFSDSMNSAARSNLEQAEKLVQRSEKETKYIAAMWIRFPDVAHVEQHHQEWREFLYGAKMLMVWKNDPSDLLAGCLAAEAFANRFPWNFYAPESESPQPPAESMTWKALIDVTFPSRAASEFVSVTGWALDDRVLDGFELKEESLEKKVRDDRLKPLARVIEQLLLKIMEVDPAHPLATHLHIHLTEASVGNEPRKGLPSAEHLSNVSLQWKSGHLVHMPSHIFLRVGEYEKAIAVNEDTHKVDIETSQNCMEPYVPEHNLKVLIAAASLGGLFDKAEAYSILVRTIKDRISMTRYIPSGWDYVTLLDVWGHFGKWEKILASGPPTYNARGGGGSGGLDFSTAMYHFYRFMALSHLAKSEKTRKLLAETTAEMEWKAFREAAVKMPPPDKTLPGQGPGIYGAAYHQRTQIAMLYAQARNASLDGDLDGAIGYVYKVMDVVNEMGYMEPPWAEQPPKQCLGYLLTLDKRYEEAKRAFDQDLAENPWNPWSMLGLAQLYASMHLRKESETMMFKFSKSGSAELDSSCPLLHIE